jgi:hypothetical protein
MVFKLEEPSTKLYLKNLLLFLFFFKESKLGPKVLLRNRNQHNTSTNSIFVRGNPQQGMGHKGQPFTN